mmetsp:Transcript_77904/g.252616  ORF Transcript_77904/g.252616 Transcript_77904/m.252616 type:complete len:457 (+) Transcript_77904:74-1444(+)
MAGACGGACRVLDNVRETMKCLNCDNSALETYRPRFRVGTTTTFADEPVSGALKQKLYKNLESCAVDWVICPDDGSAIMAMLNVGIIDMVMARIEDAVMLTRWSKSLRVCGMFDCSPHLWRLLVPRKGRAQPIKPLKIKTLGVPEHLAGSMMTCLLQDWDLFGWLDDPPEIVVMRSLVEGLREMNTRSSVQALLWECSDSESSTIQNVCTEVMEPFLAPWKSHAFVCTRETVFAKSSAIRQFFDFTNNLVQDMRANEVDRVKLEAYIMNTYGVSRADVRRWIEESPMHCTADVDYITVSRPLQYLRRLQVIPTEKDPSPTLRLASCVRLLGAPVARPPPNSGRAAARALPGAGPSAPSSAKKAPPRPDAGCDFTNDICETDEGPRSTLSSSQEVRLMPSSVAKGVLVLPARGDCSGACGPPAAQVSAVAERTASSRQAGAQAPALEGPSPRPVPAG